MSRLYTSQPDRSTVRPDPLEEVAKARQQNRVLAWVVGSAVAMHLLVVVGVLWLARAQGLEQAARIATPNEPARHAVHALHTTPAALTSTGLPGRSQPDRATADVATAPEPAAHWSTAQSKDRSAPWRVDANGHVVLNRAR